MPERWMMLGWILWEPRMAEHMELLGADYCEHDVYHPGVGVTRWTGQGKYSTLDNPKKLMSQCISFKF